MSKASGSNAIDHLPRRRNLVAAFLLATAAIAGCTGDPGPVGPPGKDGSNGASGSNGTNGTNGTSCSITHNPDGTSTIHCTDGTSVTVASGKDGVSCTVTSNGNGTRTITCADGSSVIVQDAVVDYAVMTPDELKASSMAAVITQITVPADGRPVVNLKVSERHGMGVKNLSASAISWRFALLKLDTGVNGSANETWVSYMAGSSTSTASTETATAAGLTDNADGTYTYRFTKVITAGIAAAGAPYEPDKPHRLVILMSASGNPFAPLNLVKDFIPTTGADVTGQHEKFDGAACLECHTQFRAIADGTGAFGAGEFHAGGRYDTRVCVACHNDQRRFTPLSATTVGDSAISATGTWTGNLAVINGEATLNLPVFIHKIHMGDRLALKGGTYSGVPTPYETTYPQDIRNCTKCHRNPGPNNPAPMAANWDTQPSRRACGSCHDDKSFVSPPPAGRTLHTGGALANDDHCLLCHGPGGIGGEPAAVHKAVSLPNPNNIYLNPTSGNANTNAAYVAAAGYVPPGAKVLSYEVSSVALDGSGHPQIVFRILKADPTAAPPVPAAPVAFQTFGPGTTELIPGFVGSPSAYFVYALPQDGITAPADFNVSVSGYLRNIWNGTATGSGAGTLSAPDGSGFYTLTLTGVTVPGSATMLTGGIGYTYSLGSAPTFANNTQPFTEIDLPAYPYTPNASGNAGTGGLIVPPPDVSKVATGFTGRRAIVSNAKCDFCHVSLGVGPDFHAGQRNDAPTCAFCHRPNQTSSGWAANAKDFIHGIHAAEKRLVPFNWHAESPTEGFYNVTYPAVLNKCEMCHLPGTYDFSLTSTISALPKMLPSTVGQGRYNASPVTNPAGYFSISAYVTADNTTDYGFGYSTSNVSATLPDGISGTQDTGGGTLVNCTPAAPCSCSAARPCSVPLAGTYKVNNIDVSYTQKIGSVTTSCNATTPCTCTTSQPCTGVVAACSLAAPCNAQGTTLVNSPIAAACVACHDSSSAIDHMQTNGASIWEPRSIALTKPQKEECLICHGPNRLANIALVHTDRTP
ncbi:MAG TPA: OmcA/MtrC family decaheme c-type cytochrome [Kofleriaceae bacterium]